MPTKTVLRHATFRQLYALHCVARLGSVSAAAEQMNLTQPAVSIQIATLEQSTGTPLLQRTGRGVRLTEAGELLAGYARRILELWREAGEEISAYRGVFAGTLRVGAVTTAEYLLPPLMVDYAKDHPRVQVQLQVGNRDQIVRMLLAQEIDLAIMGRPPAELKTVSTPFARHPMAFLAAPAHPLMSARGLNLATLAGANILVRERGSGTRATVERLFKEAGIPLRIGSEMSSNEALKQMCAAGFGIAFLSLHTCVLELEAGLLKVLPMPGNPLERDWYVLHLAGRQMSYVAETFEKFLCEQGQALISSPRERRRYAKAAGSEVPAKAAPRVKPRAAPPPAAAARRPSPPAAKAAARRRDPR